jgi:hypothetical protein
VASTATASCCRLILRCFPHALDPAAARWAINLDIRAANRSIRRFYMDTSGAPGLLGEAAAAALGR